MEAVSSSSSFDELELEVEKTGSMLSRKILSCAPSTKLKSSL